MFNRVKIKLTQFDLGFLVVVVISLLAIWPFISRSSLPQATDAELHIFRLAELSRLIRAGEFFPRWAPNFYYGYGYPIFNYYAPFVYYFGLIFELMPLLGPVEAVKILFVLGFVLASIGMYGYVREVWGRLAGLVAAAAYIYAPYLLYIDPHARGDLAEAFTFALFPLTLWALERLRKKPSSTNWIASSLLTAAIILTHNLMAMVFFGVILGWVIWQEIIRNVKTGSSSTKNWKWYSSRLRLFLALILGVGCAATFWLVVALEQDAVNLSSVIGNGGHFDFRNHFLTLQELFSASRLIDWGAAGPAYKHNLGIAQWIFAVIGAVAIIFNFVRARKQAWFFVIGSVLLLLLMLPVSSFIWENLPLLPYLQFPWRFLGPLAAFLAILAGIGTSALIDHVGLAAKPWIPAIAIALVLLLALPLIQVQPWPADFGPTTAGRVLSEELAGRWLGTTSTADFVPATVDVVPRPQGSLVEEILDNQPIDRVNRATLPEGTDVRSQEETPLHFIYKVRGDQAFMLRLFLFDFPGWQTRIDGEVVETELGRPEGFLVIPVPPGDHVVEVEFTNTAPRNLAIAISLTSLGLILLVAWHFRASRQSSPSNNDVSRGVSLINENRSLLPSMSVAVVVFLVNLLVIQPAGLLHYEYEGTRVEKARHSVSVDFGEQIALIGYDSPDKPVHPGEQIHFTAYWQLLSEPVTNYQVFLHLSDANGKLVAQSDKLNPGDMPARRWPDDKYIIDSHTLELPDDLDPGIYTISIGLWVANEGWRLPVVDMNGNVVSDSFLLPEQLILE